MIPAFLVPWLLRAGAALALALTIFGAGHRLGARGVQAEWDADKLAQASRTNDAVRGRLEQNAALATTQATTNATITKAKNEELAPVVRRIYVDRVRVGAASCGGRPAATPEAPGAGGRDDANPPGRLVRDDVERDTRALTEAVEHDLATGRACQAFVRENGLAP